MGTFSVYDIIKRAQAAYSTIDTLLGTKIGDPKFKPRYDGPAANERESSNLGSTLRKRDVNGRWYFMPVVLVYKGKEYEMPNSLITIRGKKHIVSTPMVGRKGTVKELISMEDYEIRIQGVALDTDWPDDQLAAIKEIYSVNESVQLKCALTDIFMEEDDMVVIKSIDIPEMRGVEHAQTYSLDLETDRSFELIME
ncbi:MAG: hypothetical protein J5952_03165 [Prevotella sp.]|nr:hypothetical protein [Prevotella sp.]